MFELSLIFGIIFLGAGVQRVSGMGFGLITGPVLAMVLGPIEGILVLNVMAVINAAMMTATSRRDVKWQRFGLIASVLVVGAIPAAFLLTVVPVAVVLAMVGALTLVSLAIVTSAQGKIPHAAGRVPALIAGIAAGFMNTLAGVAGPALMVYAQASRWEQKSFSATLQPIFVVAGVVSIVVKMVSGAANLDHTEILVWPVGLAAMTGGLLLGSVLSRNIPAARARKFAIGIAVAGAAAVFVRGILGLLA